MSREWGENEVLSPHFTSIIKIWKPFYRRNARNATRERTPRREMPGNI
jgi:hypothetical protein